MSSLSPSLLERICARTRLPYSRLVIVAALILLLLPVVATLLDGELSAFFSTDQWQLLFLPPTIAVYILLVYPPMNRAQEIVVDAFQPIVKLPEEDYRKLVFDASLVSPRAEGLAFAAGVLFYIVSARPWVDSDGISWLLLSYTLTSGVMYGMLFWVGYSSISGTRLMSVLHEQPLRVDLFDQRPFAPIGRQSLLTVLVFIGGCTISLFFLVTPENILTVPNLLVNGSLILIAVLFFFLNMRPTHRVLSTTKKGALQAVLGQIAAAYERFSADDANERSALIELEALIACEQRLKEIPTWPYDTGMLRTLFISVLIPAAAGAARVAANFLVE